MKRHSVQLFVLFLCMNFARSEGEGPDVNRTCERTLLHNYTELGNSDEVKERLMSVPEEMYQVGCDGKAAVHSAVEQGFPFIPNLSRDSKTRDFVVSFINAGFNVHHKFDGGNTILFNAVRRGNAVAVRTLLEFGSCADERNDEGSTPLMEAVKLNRKEVCEMLVEYGANVSRTFSGGDGYLHLFVENGTTEQVQLLVQLGAPLELKNIQGLSALEKAISKSSVPMLNVFLLKNVGGKREDVWNEALASAVTKGSTTVLWHLLKRTTTERCGSNVDLRLAWKRAIDESNVEALELMYDVLKCDTDFVQSYGKDSLEDIIVLNNTVSLNYLFSKGLKLASYELYSYLKNPQLMANTEMVRILMEHSPPLGQDLLIYLILVTSMEGYYSTTEYLRTFRKD